MRRLFGMMLLVVGAAAVATATHYTPPSSVPEIDPTSVGSAVALISGGLLLIGARRKK